MNKNNILTIIKYSNLPTISHTATIIIPLAPSVASKILTIDKLRKILKTLLIRPKLLLKNNELTILKNTNINSQNITRSFSILDKNKMLHLVYDFHKHDINNINDDIENLNIEDYLNKITNDLKLIDFKFTHIFFHYNIFN